MLSVHRSVKALLCRVGPLTMLALTLSGCASLKLSTARSDFSAGRYEQADQTLTGIRFPDRDRVLYLMERGTIRQARGAYRESSRDFIEAADILQALQTYSVSKGATSLVVNDTVQNFRGAPFERALLHALTAQNHLALGLWDNASVESRRIIEALTPEVRGNYPEDAYSRYMAGFGLEMIDDTSNSELQYRRADELSTRVGVDPLTGWLSVKTTNGVAGPVGRTGKRVGPTELVCFVQAGRGLAETHDTGAYLNAWSPVYGEIYYRGRSLGRSYTLVDTVDLAFTTDQVEAARKAVKTISRIAIKEGIAGAIERDNEALAALVRFVLIGLLEQPDMRRWETLPRWMGVARVSCPPDLTDFDVVFKTAEGAVTRTVHVTQPIARRRNTFVSFCRDLMPAVGTNTPPAAVKPAKE